MNQKAVMIYGAGQCGIMAQTYLKKDLRIIGFMDRREDLQGTDINGIPVIHPDKAAEYNPDLIIIAVLNTEQNLAVMEWLVEKGIPRERILSIRSMKEYLDLRFSAARLIAREIKGRDVPGAVAELGVYKGELAALINELYPDRRLYLFDTFKGFDERDVEKELRDNLSFARSGDFQDTSMEAVRDRLPYPAQAIFRKGYFPESAEALEENFAFVSLDADLYNPIYEGLRYFYPRMSRGGYILIHDYNSLQFKGAGNAVRQYCTENGLFIVPLSDAHGSAVLVKP